MKNYIILITCTDQKGLIAKITSILYSFDINILELNEFVDTQTKKFFVRLDVMGQLDENLFISLLSKDLPEDSSIQISEKSKKSIVVLATKEYHCLSDLLLKHHFGELDANIACVIANYDTLGELTEKFNIPFYHISHSEKSKEDFELEIINICNQYKPDYLVLAKFMRILTAEFVSNFPNQIINIHHSFLPAFIGANPYRQAFDRGVKMIGATAHFVNNDLDEGPIITQKTIDVNHTYKVEDLVEAGHEVESETLAAALKLVFNSRVFVNGNKTVIFK